MFVKCAADRSVIIRQLQCKAADTRRLRF